MESRAVAPHLIVIGFSLAVAAAGVVFMPHEAWPHVLLSGVFLSGIGLGGAFLLAVHDVSGGRWLGPVRSIARSLTRLVLPGSAVVLVAVVLGGSRLYPAFHETLHGFKGAWLDPAFFIARSAGYGIVWVFAIARLRRRKGSASFLVLFGLTVWLSSVDWVMSLEPHWGSTMFGVYRFAGLFVAALAVVAIMTAYRSRHEVTITGDHLHDVGRLLFAFSTFWMYIWFSQAMLVWYANLDEETTWYVRRTTGLWSPLFWLTVVLVWVVPFLLLLSGRAKRNPATLMRVGFVVLIGHWLDLYVSIIPPGMAQPSLTGWELAMALGAFATVGWVATGRELREVRGKRARQAAGVLVPETLVPEGVRTDPR